MHIVVHPGEKLSELEEIIGLFGAFLTFVDHFRMIYGIFGPIFVNVGLILAIFLNYWTESYKTLTLVARKGRFICRSAWCGNPAYLT